MKKTLVLLLLLAGLTAGGAMAQAPVKVPSGKNSTTTTKPNKPTDKQRDVSNNGNSSYQSDTQDCFRDNFNKGKAYYKAGRYEEARSCFQQAKRCPVQQEFIDLDEWIAKCNKELYGEVNEIRNDLKDAIHKEKKLENKLIEREYTLENKILPL